MQKFIAWWRSEPVRSVLYPSILILIGLGLKFGWFSGDLADAVEQILAILVGGTVATEVARSQVSPAKSKPPADQGSARVSVIAGVVVAAMLAGVGLWLVDRPSPEPIPAPAPVTTVVVVDPLTVPSTPVEDLVAPSDKPGDLPDNGITPPGSDQPSDVQYVADGLGGGNVTWTPEPTKNPWTAPQALVYLAGQVVHPDKNYYNLCAHLASWVYGYYGYGYQTAEIGAENMPAKYRHKIPANLADIPAGANVYFMRKDGAGYAGHVITSNGDGRAYSNDISVKGAVSLVNISVFKSRWGMRPSFWSPPVFPAAFGHNPNPAPKITPVKPAKPVVNLTNIQKAARTRGDASGVRHYRRNLGMSEGTHFGKGLETRYREWQRHEGLRGKDADGIPGCKTSKALKRHGPDKNWVVKCP